MAVRVAGLLLAAGAGRRSGGPKALRTDADGTSWLVRSARVLQLGGCPEVTVVLGCRAQEAREVLDAYAWTHPPTVVEAPDWAEGMGTSLRAGLVAVAEPEVSAVLVHLVDLPDVGAEVVRRLLARGSGPATLARASYAGRPGHPVLLGRDHLGPVAAGLVGDRGARGYLDRHGATGVECGDLATGADQDR